jgi:hypothetical protein
LLLFVNARLLLRFSYACTLVLESCPLAPCCCPQCEW